MIQPDPARRDASDLALALLNRLIPDARGLFALGLFAVVFYLLHMIGQDPALLKDSSFMGLAMLLCGTGGLGLAATFFFGGTKTGAEVMKSQSDAVILSGQQPPPAAPTARDAGQ
jgi:hypothetical protein